MFFSIFKTLSLPLIKNYQKMQGHEFFLDANLTRALKRVASHHFYIKITNSGRSANHNAENVIFM